MLSVVLYGRNDSHGYNLHKRMAISINCIAEVLTDENDEILFVDYNTLNNFPTVIESIEDTLTDTAKSKLRIFRVRPEDHKRFLGKRKTHLNTIEPIARNVAIRRSNPKNKWILSTNTDIVFVPKTAKSLTDIVSKLNTKYHYALPRFEIPEALWESQDRKNPSEIINKFDFYGQRFHINHIVEGAPTILYDAPGDFQLMPRKALFKMSGFDERMIWGWHLDSNIAIRLDLLGVKIKSLFPETYIYHCNHTKALSIAHSSKTKKHNSLHKFCETLETPYVPSQESSWGLNDHEIEEISIANKKSYEDILKKIIPSNERNIIKTSNYTHKSHNTKIPLCSSHISSYLIDILCSLSKDSIIGYLGHNDSFFSYLTTIINTLGFSNTLKKFDHKNTHQNINLLIIDVGTARNKIILSALFKSIAACNKNTKFIFIGAINNLYEFILQKYFSFLRASYNANCTYANLIPTRVPTNLKLLRYTMLHIGMIPTYWTLVPGTIYKTTKKYPNAHICLKKFYRALKLKYLFLTS